MIIEASQMIKNLYQNKNKDWSKNDIYELAFIILPAYKKHQPGYSIMHIARYFGRTQKSIKTMINKIEKNEINLKNYQYKMFS